MGIIRISRRIARANARAKASWNDPRWQKTKEPPPKPKPKPVQIVPVAAPVQSVDAAFIPQVDESGMQWRRTLTFPPWDTTTS